MNKIISTISIIALAITLFACPSPDSMTPTKKVETKKEQKTTQQSTDTSKKGRSSEVKTDKPVDKIASKSVKSDSSVKADNPVNGNGQGIVDDPIQEDNVDRQVPTVDGKPPVQVPSELELAQEEFTQLYTSVLGDYSNALQLLSQSPNYVGGIFLSVSAFQPNANVDGLTLNEIETKIEKLETFKNVLDTITTIDSAEETFSAIRSIASAQGEFLSIAGASQKDVQAALDKQEMISEIHNLYETYATTKVIYDGITAQIIKAFEQGGFTKESIAEFHAPFAPYVVEDLSVLYSKLHGTDFNVLTAYSKTLIDFSTTIIGFTNKIPNVIEEEYLTYASLEETRHPLVEYILSYNDFLESFQETGEDLTIDRATIRRLSAMQRNGYTGLDAREYVVTEFNKLENNMLSRLDAFAKGKVLSRNEEQAVAKIRAFLGQAELQVTDVIEKGPFAKRTIELIKTANDNLFTPNVVNSIAGQDYFTLSAEGKWDFSKKYYYNLENFVNSAIGSITGDYYSTFQIQ